MRIDAGTLTRVVAVGFAGACASLGVACDVGQSSELANETLTDGPAPSGGGPGGEGDDSPADSTGGNGSNSDPDSDDPPDDPLPDFGGAQGCDYAGDDAAQPFGHHAHSYADGTILPSGSLGQLDAAVADVYGQWRQQFLRQGCGDGRYYVTIGGDDSLTVSEAHGYGMLIAVYMAGFDPDAREFFDGLHAYYRDHPSTGTPPLMAWSQDHSCTTNLGGSSATDGDLDIAYALLLADKQWGSGGTIDYLGEATELLWAITNVELGEGYVYLGDWVGDAYYRQATRSSDFMPNHFAAFEDIVGDGRWENAIGTTYSIMSAVQSSDSGLLPDFAQWVTSDPIPAEPWFLEREWDGDYSYNACRVPWRIGLGYLADGDSRARNLLNPMIGWFQNATGGDPWNMASGYRLWGEPLPGADFPSMTYIAPMGIAAMLDPSRQALLDSIWEAAAYSDLTGVYYDDTLRLLSMIAMSGNWWSPQHAACP